MTVELPLRKPMPLYLVLAFMAGLSAAARFSAQCYVDELVMELATGARGAAS